MASWCLTEIASEPGTRGADYSIYSRVCGSVAKLKRWDRRVRPLIVLILAIGLSACSSPPLPSYGTVSPFTLTDQNGEQFNSAALKGKVWIADFFFTNCPGPCPRMSSQMHQLQQAFTGEDAIRLISFTVDPARDTPPVLAEYAKHFEAKPGKWFFLTGPQAELNDLSRRSFMQGEVDGSLEHSTRFALVDRSFRIRGFYVSSDKDAVPNLIADAKKLLGERL
jgi:protein SCO1/2